MERKIIKTVPYIVQLHEAYRAGRHYDLRLQYPYKSKLASWAIPRAQLPEKPGNKVTIIKTPDHDKSWLNFAGEIPRGEYGGGKVFIAQKGTADILAWSDTFITFVVSGKLLNGKYGLVKMKATRKQEIWLLVKGKDE
jgi:bifunctional non-homologous end joining protein LigD